MRLALALAWRGWGRVHPNPMVGAVVLAGEQSIAEGWHEEFGQPHAETVALESAGRRANGATLVVTLEPCNHEGKQPPCVDAILRAGIRRVVFGANDPSPAARGGALRLSAAGLEVTTLPVAQEVRDQNPVFFHGLEDGGRPYVALKLATSVDGRVADYTGRSRWISGPAAREWVHWLRAGFDAIGVGGRTARTDDPTLTVRGRVTPRVPPRRIVFDRRGDLSGATRLLGTAREIPVTVVVETPAPGDVVNALSASGIEVLACWGLPDALVRLRDSGIGSLLVEGGGRLAARLFAEGLIDRFYWVQSPIWLGEDGLHAFGGLPSPLLEQAERWRVIERRELGEDTLLVLSHPMADGGPQSDRETAISASP